MNYDDWTLSKLDESDYRPKEFRQVVWEYFNATSAPGTMNQCTFNTATGHLANSVYDLSSSVISQNVVITCTTTGLQGDPFVVGPKPCGLALALIDAATITIANNTVTQANQRNPIFQWIKCLFSFSQNYMKLFGPLIFAGQCSADEEVRSWSEVIPGATAVAVPGSATAGLNPGGVPGTAPSVTLPGCHRNNCVSGGLVDICPVQTTQWDNGAFQGDMAINKALYSRILDMAYPTSLAVANSAPVYNSSGPTLSTYNLNVPIPLKILHNFFEKVGLVKNINMILNVRYNACSGLTNGWNAGAGQGTGCNTTAGNFAYGYCPLMLTDRSGTSLASMANVLCQTSPILSVFNGAVTAIPGTLAATNTTAVKLEIGVGGSDLPQFWSPRIVFKGEDAMKFDLHTKVVKYTDFTNGADIKNQVRGAQVNQLISGGVVAPKRVYVLLHASAAANVTGASALQSTVTPAPHYSDPLCTLTNIQFQVASQNKYLQPINYDWREFLEEILPLNELQGGQDSRLACGLYSKRAFDNAPMYVFDVSRQVTDPKPVALSINATNASLYNSIDVISFIEQECETTISFAPTGTTATPYQYVI